MRSWLWGVVVLVLGAHGASAHPHAWIDVSSELVFDGEGRAVALRQHWLFDDFYTAETVEGRGQGELQDLTARIMENLAEYRYFTEVTSNGEDVAFDRPVETSARLEGRRLAMGFLLPFAAPAGGGRLTYSIFDPTFFIEMLHAEQEGSYALAGAPPGCRARLVPPKPDPELLALAAALDRGQQGGDTLGRHFAEKVEVTCAPAP